MVKSATLRQAPAKKPSAWARTQPNVRATLVVHSGTQSNVSALNAFRMLSVEPGKPATAQASVSRVRQNVTVANRVNVEAMHLTASQIAASNVSVLQTVVPAKFALRELAPHRQIVQPTQLSAPLDTNATPARVNATHLRVDKAATHKTQRLALLGPLAIQPQTPVKVWVAAPAAAFAIQTAPVMVG